MPAEEWTSILRSFYISAVGQVVGILICSTMMKSRRSVWKLLAFTLAKTLIGIVIIDCYLENRILDPDLCSIYSAMISMILSILTALMFTYTYEGGFAKAALGMSLGEVPTAMMTLPPTILMNQLQGNKDLYLFYAPWKAADLLLIPLTMVSVALIYPMFRKILLKYRTLKLKRERLWMILLLAYFGANQLMVLRGFKSNSLFMITMYLFYLSCVISAAVVGYLVYWRYQRRISFENEFLAAQMHQMEIHYAAIQSQMEKISGIQKNIEEQMEHATVILKLSYEEVDIVNAGVDISNENQIGLCHWNEEEQAYNFVEDCILDTEANTVTVQLKEGGEYILAVDTEAPQVTQLSVSDNTELPVITACIADFSGIQECILSIDDSVVLAGREFLKYYNRNGVLEYSVLQPLAEGEHMATILLTDTNGNSMESAVKLVWNVQNIKPDISDSITTINLQDKEDMLEVKVSVKDDNLSQVYAQIKVQDEVQMLPMNESTDELWSVLIGKEACGETVYLKFIAMDESGNKVIGTEHTLQLKHDFGEWTVTKSATCTQNGEKEHVCKICKRIEKQSTTGFKVTGLANGDSIKSMTLSNMQYVKLSNVNLKNGTCKLTALKKKDTKGTTKLIITLASGLKKEVPIKVQTSAVKTTKITNVDSTLMLKMKEKFTLKPVLQPFTSVEKVKYSTSNKKVVKVSSKGVLTAVKPGKAKIAIKAGKKKVTCTVTVEGIKCTDLQNVKTEISLKKKQSVKLGIKKVPSNSTDIITYKTSNKKIATVDANGKVTGKKAGTATITITCGSVVKKCKVAVQ